LLCLVGALCAVTVAGLAVIPPSGCPEYALDDHSLPALALFTANVFHYNKDNLMSGNPVGPYYGIDEAAGCSWRPNGAFSCHLRIYTSAAKTRQIGTGLMSSNNLIWNNDAFNTSGGFVNLTTTISGLLASEYPNSANADAPENRNFKSQTRLLYFKPQVVYPDAPADPIANRVLSQAGQQYLALWGSDGYNAASGQYDAALRGTGIDFMGHLTCPDNPPPVIPGCPCEDPAQIFSVDRDDIVHGQEISRRSSGTCIELHFSA